MSTRAMSLKTVLISLLIVIAEINPSVWAQGPTIPDVVDVPAGEFLAGSTASEREYGYRLDEVAYGHDLTRKRGWYDRERPRSTLRLPGYQIMTNLVTNATYHRFVAETGWTAPWISEAAWKRQGLIHPYERVRKFLWRDGRPPKGREDHPVVLVNWHDANAFARWLSAESGETWRLPTEEEWEKAARGRKGNIFPWGNRWNPKFLNSQDEGPFDTVAAGSFSKGASPFGMLDGAGQVFEWTSARGGEGRHLVKGGSWDDKGCGVCRAAARHARPDTIRHILIGFRLVRIPSRE